MDTTICYIDSVYIYILGLHRDNGKENGNDYIVIEPAKYVKIAIILYTFGVQVNPLGFCVQGTSKLAIRIDCSLMTNIPCLYNCYYSSALL